MFEAFLSKNVIFCNFLLMLAIFLKTFSHEVKWVTRVASEEVTYKVFSLYNSGILTRARKFFMKNIVFPKVYMRPFLPWVVINSPHDMQG